MNLPRSQYGFIFSLQLTTLLQIFNKYNHEIRLCGGAVRDILLEKKPTDLDFATTATPDEMVTMFKNEKIQMVNQGGIKHGTVTPLIRGICFEITTLRIDVETDGRHAEVEFTKDWKLDAQRRDFTVNSMFLGMNGTVYDYFNGFKDLKNHVLQFVGNPRERITEDYLRILRYFRFYEPIVNASRKHDQNVLDAIQEKGSGLKQIAGQRIWPELDKMMKGIYGPELMKTILNLGLGTHIGFPDKPNITEFDRVINQNKDSNLRTITMLSALVNKYTDANKLIDRLKLTITDKNLLRFILNNKNRRLSPDTMTRFKVKMILNPNRQKLMALYIEQLLMYRNERKLLEEFKNWKPLRFPISGEKIISHGVNDGKVIGLILNNLAKLWVESNYTITFEELLSKIPREITRYKRFLK